MKERPILFSAPMVRAILAGTKTMTRRIVTVPWQGSRRTLPYSPYWSEEDGVLSACDESCDYHEATTVMQPYGVAGDRLWVRETFAPQPGREDSVDLPEYDGGKNPDAVCYRADERAPGEDPEWIEGISHGVRRWRPAIFLPRWASRITLDVTGVRVERLHAITEAGAIAEGVGTPSYPATVIDPHVTLFSILWDKINGKRAAWHTNPWVYVVSFRRAAQP